VTLSGSFQENANFATKNGDKLTNLSNFFQQLMRMFFMKNGFYFVYQKWLSDTSKNDFSNN